MGRYIFLLLAALFSSSPAIAQERVDPIPMGPEKIVKALSPFSRNPDSSKVAKLLREQASDSGFPSSDTDRVLIARLWRRAGEPELALEALSEIDPFGSDSDLAMYERARVWLESDTNQMSGVRAYWSSCRSDDGRVRAEIEWDLLAVTIPEEREAWPEVEPGEATCEWLRQFWDERAQRMAVPGDERLTLHHERLAHAREWYWIPRPRFSISMADYHGRNGGVAFDDRGLIYVRMGDPVHKEVCSDPVLDVLGECWAYERPAGYKLYHFRIDSTRADADYRIWEKLGTAAKVTPGDPWFQKYVMNADIPNRAKVRFVQRGGRIARASVRDARERAMDLVEDAPAARDVELATRRFTSEALEQIPDVPDVESTVALRFETLRFLNPWAGKWQIWLLSSVRAGHLTPSSNDDDAVTLDVGGRYSILTPAGVTVNDLLGRSLPAGSVNDEAGVTLRSVFSADPGPLPLTVVIEDINAPGTGAWIQDTVHVPAIGGLPQLSDIAVAQAEGGTWTRDAETYLQVSPAHMTNPDGSIHTYFEVYGVGSGAVYEVELRLARADDAEDVFGLKANDLAFRLQFRSEMSGDIGRHHLRLELGDTKPGEYTLAVRIQDADSRAYSLPAITDLFVAER